MVSILCRRQTEWELPEGGRNLSTSSLPYIGIDHPTLQIERQDKLFDKDHDVVVTPLEVEVHAINLSIVIYNYTIMIIIITEISCLVRIHTCRCTKNVYVATGNHMLYNMQADVEYNGELCM